ncbi:MAG: type II secretion system F family protein [Hyphomonadaceae bacterium]|nr:type II secretion system F family protein [Hyphomonadaceae bacterium]
MAVNVSAVFLILVFAAVFTAGHALFGMLTVAKQRFVVNRRLQVSRRIDGGLANLVGELRKQRGLTATGEHKGWMWLSILIVRSGVPYEPRRWCLALAAVAAAGAAGGFALGHSPLSLLVGALVAVSVLPVGFLKWAASRRHTALGKQLPQGLDIIVRSLEAGHPVPTAIALVAREMPDPIGSEFGMAADEIAYGATLSEAVTRMSARCRHPDVRLFAATVRLGDRTGANLARLLRLNASTVRERLKMRLKIKAVSSEGRASALILTAAPFLVGLFMQLSSPSFYGNVIQEPLIQKGLAALGVWMFIGNIVIRRMINLRI